MLASCAFAYNASEPLKLMANRHTEHRNPHLEAPRTERRLKEFPISCASKKANLIFRLKMRQQLLQDTIRPTLSFDLGKIS
jgi:hypothetical protein